MADEEYAQTPDHDWLIWVFWTAVLLGILSSVW